MLEVVFSDSAAGAMLAAIERPHVVGGAALKANGGGERDAAILQAEAEERERRGWENAVPLEGDRENILCLPLALSVGNISQTGIGAEREKALSLLMGVFRAWRRRLWASF